MINRLWMVAVSLICCVGLCSCGTVPDTVATVNGTKITGEEYEHALNGFLANYGLTEESLYESLGADEAVAYKNNIIDEMVLQELMMQYAAQNDLDELSRDDKENIANRAESYLKNLKESFVEDVAAEEMLAGEAAQSEAERRYDEYVNLYKYTEENLRDQFARQTILDRVYEHVMRDSEIREEEVRSYYDAQIENASALEADMDAETAIAEYVHNRDELNLFVPRAVSEGVRNVKHILVRIPEDVSAQIAQLNANEQHDAAQQLREQALTLIKPKAEEVIAKAREGVDFETLITEYNDDPGMEYNPEGYEVYEGASFDAAFLDEALSLKNVGDISDEPVESAFGYHIIEFYSSPKAGAVPYDEVHDDIEEQLRENRRRELWETAVADWKMNADIEKHEFRTTN